MRLLKLLGAFVLSFGAAAIGSVATSANIPTWYATLDKPFFTPPNGIFGPVWTLLYTFIAISLYLVWSKRPPAGNHAYWWFGAQLILNTLWSLVFFGAHQLWLAFGIIIALSIAIIGTIRSFWPISRPAAYLLLPYLAWVIFATCLNGAIAILNS